MRISSPALWKWQGLVNGTRYTFSRTGHSHLPSPCPDGTKHQDYGPDFYDRNHPICFSGCFKKASQTNYTKLRNYQLSCLNVEASLSENWKCLILIVEHIWHPLLRSGFCHVRSHAFQAFVDTQDIFSLTHIFNPSVEQFRQSGQVIQPLVYIEFWQLQFQKLVNYRKNQGGGYLK